MKIIVAKSAGYCFGVNKAMDAVEYSINHFDTPIFTLGPIIHNNQVIKKLENKDVYSIDTIKESNNSVVLIRSHGVEPSIYIEAKDKNIKLIDATCPYVKNIQKKVEKHYDEGYQIIIIGDKNHPEVIGVNGWSKNTAIILDNKEEAENIPKHKKLCIVCQTTITQEKFLEITSILLRKSREVLIFNTICNATISRQDETKDLAKKVDIMIVIGGYHSSNTQKLVNISKKHCDNTYHIETYKDLPKEIVMNNKIIGITAGASTPDWIIREVINNMENNNNKQNQELNFQESIEKSMVSIKPEEIIEGEVLSVDRDTVVVNIGYKSDGTIIKDEYTDKKDVSLEELVQIGDKIQVMVLDLNDGEGNVILSKKKVDQKMAREKLKEAYDNKKVLKGKVIKSIKGGFIVELGMAEAFMPISQYHIKFVKDLETVVGEDVEGEIIEYNPTKNRVIFSQRILLERELKEKKEKVFGTLEEGATVTGKVKSLVKFGAFIDLGGVDGLIHISDLTWGRVNKPEEILSIGDVVKAKVVEIDKEKERIKLSLKHLVEEPWVKFIRLYNIGDRIPVKIVKITSFGAFAEIFPGVEGLIHKSQISYDTINKVEDVLSPGQELETQIIDIDKNKRKIGLSIIELQEKPTKIFDKNETVYKEEESLTLGDIFGGLFKEEK